MTDEELLKFYKTPAPAAPVPKVAPVTAAPSSELTDDQLLALYKGPAAPSAGRVAKQVVGDVVRSGVDMVAAVPTSIAIAANKLEKKFPALALGEDPNRPVTDMPTFKLGEVITEIGRVLTPDSDPELEKSFWASKVPKGVGSAAAFMGGGVAGKLAKVPAWAATMLMGSMAGSVEGYKDAVANGATDDQAFKSYLLNAGVGTTEIIPLGRMLRRLDGASGGTLGKALVNAGKDTFEEALQEAFQGVSGNAIAKHLVGYDKDRELLRGLEEDAAVGGTTGAVMSLLTSAIVGRVRGSRLKDLIKLRDETAGQRQEVYTGRKLEQAVQKERGLSRYGRRKETPEQQAMIDGFIPDQSVTGNPVTPALPVAPASKEVIADEETREEEGVQVLTPPSVTPVADGPSKPVSLNFQGLDIKITNPVGTVRSGTDAAGNKWSVTMPASYGDIRRTEGKDGDPVDVYVGPNPQSPLVFVVDQQKKEGQFDEIKTMVGFDTEEQAVAAYDAAFSDGSGPSRRQAVTPTTMEEFKVWLDGDTTKPYAKTKPNTQVPTVAQAQPVAESPVASTENPFIAKEDVAALEQVYSSGFSPVIQRAIAKIQPQLDLLGVAVVPGDSGMQSGISALVFGQPDVRQITLDGPVIQAQLDALAANMPGKSARAIDKAQTKYLDAALREEIKHIATHDVIARAYGSSGLSVGFNQFARDYLNGIYAEMEQGGLVLNSVRAYLHDESITEEGLAPAIEQGFGGKTHMVAAEFVRQLADSNAGLTELSTVQSWGAKLPRLAMFLREFLKSLKALATQLKQTDLYPRINEAVVQIEQLLKTAGPRKSKLSRMAKVKPKVVQASRGGHMFDRETDLVGADILYWIKEFGGMMSRKTAKAKGKEWYTLNSADWDGSIALSAPHHNIIYRGSSTPNQIAQAAYEAGMLKEPDVNELWERIELASNARVKAIRGDQYESELIDKQANETQAWQTATAAGALQVQANQLNVGDMLDVEGEQVAVTKVDPDTGDVTLKDGTLFGIQTLADGESIWVEKIDEAAPEEMEDPFALDEVESVEDQAARVASEQAKSEAQARRNKLAELAAKPLVGTQGDIGQVDMLDPDRNDLLSRQPNDISLLAKQQADLQVIRDKQAQEQGEQVGAVATDPTVTARALDTARLRGDEALNLAAGSTAGQLGFINRKMDEHLPTDGDEKIVRAAMRALGYFDVIESNALATEIVPPAEYRDTLAKITAEYPEYRETYSKEVGLRFKLMKSKLQEVLAQREAKLKHLSGPMVQSLIDRTQAARDQADALETAQQRFEAEVKDSITAFKNLLESGSYTEGRADQLLAQIRAAESQKEFSEAVKVAVKDIVEVMSSRETSAPLLYATSGAPEIIEAYTKIKQELLAKGETQPLQDKMIVRWAAEILANSNELANRMVALSVLRKNESVREKYSQAQLKIADALKKNPAGAARSILKTTRKFATDTDKANQAFAALNRELMQELRDFEVLDVAADSARAIMSDPEVIEYEQQVYKDGRIQDRPTSLINEDPGLTLENGIGLPDGTTTPPIVLYGDDRFQQSYLTLQQAANSITTWLFDNPTNVHADYWRTKLNYIQNVLASSRVVNPAKLVQPFVTGTDFGPWGMTKFFVDDLGTRQGATLKVSLANHSRSTELASNLLHANFSKLTNMGLAGLKSHGWNRKQLEYYYTEVINPVLASWSNPENGLTKGEKVNGHTITAEDMELVQFMSRVTSEGFDIVKSGIGRDAAPVYFKTSIGDTPIETHVQSTKIGKNTTTRTYNRDGLAFLKAYNAPNANKAQVLNTYFWQVVVPEISDRASVFHDGKSDFEESFKLISKQIQQNGLALADRNMDWLVSEVSSITGKPEDEVSTALMAHFDKMVNRVSNEVQKESDDVLKVESVEQKTSFTRARKEALAGRWLYNYGFQDSAALINFTMGITAHYYERAAMDFLKVKDDLERAKRELDERITNLVTSGQSPTDARKMELKRNRSDVLLGNTFDDYSEIERKIKMADKYAQLFAGVYSKTGNNVEFDLKGMVKAFGTAIGTVLMSELTALRNLGFGWLYLGNTANSIMGATAKGYVRSAINTWIWSAPIYLGSMAYSLGKAGTVGTLKGGHDFLSEALKGNARQAIIKGLAPILTEITQNSYERVSLQKEMQDRGYAAPNHTVEDFAAKLNSPATGGALVSEPDGSWLGEIGMGALTLVDAFLLTTVGRPLLPKFADAMVNKAAMQTTFDSVHTIRNQLTKAYWFRKKHGIPLTNPLSPEEVFGRWFIGKRTMNDLAKTRQIFEWSSTTLDQAAYNLFQQLDAGNQDAQLLNDEQAFDLADKVAQEINKASAMNRPLFFKNKGPWQFIAPLMGWSASMFRTHVKWASRAASDPNYGKFALWSSVMLLTILPALIAGAIDDTGVEELARLLYSRLRGEERATRQPWEREGAKSKAIGWVISAANPIPFVQTAVNSMVNDMPNRASADPMLFMQSKARDIMNYAGGVAQTGDATFGLPRLMKGFLPLSSIYLNQLDSTKGSVEALNARRLLTRYGPQELLQDKQIPTGVTATELTPYGERMLNAVMNEDYQGFMEIRREALDVAKKIGKKDPEASVDAMLTSRNPYSRAFKTKMSGADRQAMMGRMNEAERQMVQGVEDKFARATAMIGNTATYTKEEGSGRAVGRASRFAMPAMKTMKGRRISRYAKAKRPKSLRRSRAKYKRVAPIKVKSKASRYRKPRKPSLSRYA